MIKVSLNENTGEIEGVQSGLLELAQLIFAIATRYVPVLNLVLPFSVLVDIIKAAMTVIGNDIKVDYKWLNIKDFLSLVKEATEAALNPTSVEERAQAIWALLVYMTNIETKMTYDQFIKATRDAIKAMPVPNGTPIINGAS